MGYKEEMQQVVDQFVNEMKTIATQMAIKALKTELFKSDSNGQPLNVGNFDPALSTQPVVKKATKAAAAAAQEIAKKTVKKVQKKVAKANKKIKKAAKEAKHAERTARIDQKAATRKERKDKIVTKPPSIPA